MANYTLKQLIVAPHLKDKVIIGQHTLESFGIGHTFENRYRGHSGRYDGLHFFGPSGTKDYTSSLSKILSHTLKNSNNRKVTTLPGN